MASGGGDRTWQIVMTGLPPPVRHAKKEQEMKSRIEKRMMEGLSVCRLRRDRGAMSVEYALLASFIAAAIVLLVFNLGNQVRLMIESGTKGW